MRDTLAWEANADAMHPARKVVMKSMEMIGPKGCITSSPTLSSETMERQSDSTTVPAYDNSTKIHPPMIVVSMIARGTVCSGAFASSDRVDTASKPKKDRQRIAAPATS